MGHAIRTTRCRSDPSFLSKGRSIRLDPRRAKSRSSRKQGRTKQRENRKERVQGGSGSNPPSQTETLKGRQMDERMEPGVEG